MSLSIYFTRQCDFGMGMIFDGFDFVFVCGKFDEMFVILFVVFGHFCFVCLLKCCFCLHFLFPYLYLLFPFLVCGLTIFVTPTLFMCKIVLMLEESRDKSNRICMIVFLNFMGICCL